VPSRACTVLPHLERGTLKSGGTVKLAGPSLWRVVPTMTCIHIVMTSLQVAYIRRLAAAIDTNNGESSLDRDHQQQHSSIYRCNGVFLACFQTTHIWGNLVSSLFLSHDVTIQHGAAGKAGSRSTSAEYEEIYSAADGTGAYCGTYDTCDSLQSATRLTTGNISGR